MLVAIVTPQPLDTVTLSTADTLGITDARLAGPVITPRTDGEFDLTYVTVVKMVAGTPLAALRKAFGAVGVYGMCEDDATLWRFYGLIVSSLTVPRGSLWKHHANGYYVFEKITNLLGDMAGKFRPTVVYHNVDNGNEFSRPTDEWFGKFELVSLDAGFHEPQIRFKSEPIKNDIGAVINRNIGGIQ